VDVRVESHSGILKPGPPPPAAEVFAEHSHRLYLNKRLGNDVVCLAVIRESTISTPTLREVMLELTFPDFCGGMSFTVRTRLFCRCRKHLREHNEGVVFVCLIVEHWKRGLPCTECRMYMTVNGPSWHQSTRGTSQGRIYWPVSNEHMAD
jgi:hypothetical protein